jgi:hypothetical protein
LRTAPLQELISLLSMVYIDVPPRLYKVEHRDFDAILVAPKCYLFHKNDEIIKARFKGIKIGSDKLCDESVKDDMSPLELYSLYHSGKLEITGLNIYEQLYRTKSAKVIANNIDKRVIKMIQRYICLIIRLSKKSSSKTTTLKCHMNKYF